MALNLDFNKLIPLSDNNDHYYDWIDTTINSGDLISEIEINNKMFNVYEFKQDFFGFQAVVNTQKDVIAFNPTFEFPKPTDAIIKGVSVEENGAEAILTTKKENALFSSFLLNYPNIKPHLPKILDKRLLIAFSGWVQSLDKQDNPPQIKQKDGSLVTTKGSSVFYNVEGKRIFEFVYQFNIEEVSSVIWNDFIEVIQIKTTLFKTEKEKINLYLYVTERALQNSYYPKKNDDIMGVMQLHSMTM